MTMFAPAQVSKCVALGCAVVAMTACAPKVQPQDPCAAADRPIELRYLLENSITDSYEACLAVVRDQAASALEK
ncbi:hypothetical protein K3556_13140 [Aliiroseovarius sp. M344]|uniref:hypothetical protein n=1 Tax=Aliiroseovarius sp. M344 TaxID=2867010 RepID=UPI0021AE2FBC|nr:hypothetical protein [Aliiroseovarius sp. M344]UWQ13859.1 hypothetical protein K3556_13140 [Aliiroseovarius sp. M344]